MSEEEKKHDGCCCCKCWKVIFIALALLIIGAIFGHVMTMRHHGCMMERPCCDWGMKAHSDKEGAEHHRWWGHKDGMHGPGCMCPMCCNKAARPAEPNKAACPMMEKEQGKPAIPEKK